MIWTLSIIIFLLGGGLVALVYALRISEKKIEMYEEFITNRRISYQVLLNKIQELDNKQMFEKDDEVGVVFTEIKEEVQEFEKFLD